MIVNYDSSIFNKFGASLTDEYDATVIIYDCHMFIAQATGWKGLASTNKSLFWLFVSEEEKMLYNIGTGSMTEVDLLEVARSRSEM